MALVSGCDVASRAILEEVAAQREGTRVIFKDAEAADLSPAHDEPTTPDMFAALMTSVRAIADVVGLRL